MNGLIDIKLILTQVLGFVLLVWVLGRYGWKPLLGHLEARRQKIEGDYAAAEQARLEAEQLKAKYDQDLRGIDAQARARIQEAVVEGQRVAEEIKSQAQADAQARLKRAEEEVALERDKAKGQIREQVVTLSIRTAEKILRAKLDDPAQRRLAGEFIDEVGTLR